MAYNSVVVVDVAVAIAAGVLVLSCKPFLKMVIDKRKASVKDTNADETTESAPGEKTEPASAETTSDK